MYIDLLNSYHKQIAVKKVKPFSWCDIEQRDYTQKPSAIQHCETIDLSWLRSINPEIVFYKLIIEINYTGLQIYTSISIKNYFLQCLFVIYRHPNGWTDLSKIFTQYFCINCGSNGVHEFLIYRRGLVPDILKAE